MTAKGNMHEQLSAYLDGELHVVESERVERALEADTVLRGELAQLASLRKLLRALPAEHAPEDLTTRVLAEAERTVLVGPAHAERSAGALRWVRYLATAAVLLVAATVGMVIALTLWSVPPAGYESIATRTRTEPAPPAHGQPRSAAIALADGNVVSSKDHLALRSEALTEMKAVELRPAPVAKAGPVSGETNQAKHALAQEDSVKDVGDVALVLAGANNEIIFTDRMDYTQRQVEGVLVANGLVPANVEAADRDRQAGKSFKAVARGNFYNEVRQAASEVQYEAFLTPEQMAKVQEDLGNLRAQQRVSQVAMAPADHLSHLVASKGGRGGEADKEHDEVRLARPKVDGPADSEKLNGRSSSVDQADARNLKQEELRELVRTPPPPPPTAPAVQPPPDAGPELVAMAKRGGRAADLPGGDNGKAPRFIDDEARRRLGLQADGVGAERQAGGTEATPGPGRTPDERPTIELAAKREVEPAQAREAPEPPAKPKPSPVPRPEAEEGATQRPHLRALRDASVVARTETRPEERAGEQLALREDKDDLRGPSTGDRYRYVTKDAAKPAEAADPTADEARRGRKLGEGADAGASAAGAGRLGAATQVSEALGRAAAGVPEPARPTGEPLVQVEIVGGYGNTRQAEAVQRIVVGERRRSEPDGASPPVGPAPEQAADRPAPAVVPAEVAQAAPPATRPVSPGHADLWLDKALACEPNRPGQPPGAAVTGLRQGGASVQWAAPAEAQSQLDRIAQGTIRGLYDQRGQAASQRATARLQRLIITVTYRPAEVGAEAMMEMRAKDAAKAGKEAKASAEAAH